ncbi:MauE/DoxX family redox-associated membrane protein [Belliella aquatica]|nr:MauE/DoxX family redox-associated membrane protein [Belliella aquatica]MCH7407290.1 hypothetical protein [Belliella aquatica]
MLVLIVLITLWVYTGISKLVDFHGFKGAILNQSFSNEIGEYVAFIVPISELIIAGMLVFGKTRFLGLIASICMLCVFSTYVGLVWSEAFDRVPCGCAGIFESMGWGAHLIVNLILLGMSILSVVTRK